MNEEFIIELQLTANSPLIVSKELPIGNNYLSLQYIPASMLKGAILTELRKKYCTSINIDDCAECNNDDCFFKSKILNKFIVKPGNPIDKECNTYSIFNEIPKTIQRCKKCGTLINSTLEYIESGIMIKKCSKCGNTTFSKQSGPFCSNCNSIVEVKKDFKTNIAIDREVFSTMEEMLFYYEAIRQQTSFTSLLVGEGSELKKEILDLKRIYVGRGKSRGYGAIDIKSNIEDWNNSLSEIIARIQKCKNETDKIILISLTPTASFKWTINGLATIPRIDEIEFNGAEFILEKALGSATYISGWALNTDTQKPRINAGIPGSVFVYNSENLDQHSIKQLAIKELKGFGEEILIQNSFNQFFIWSG